MKTFYSGYSKEIFFFFVFFHLEMLHRGMDITLLSHCELEKSYDLINANEMNEMIHRSTGSLNKNNSALRLKVNN